MKTKVLLLPFCVFTVLANPNSQTQLEKYADKIKNYKLEVPGKDPITIIETAPINDDDRRIWENISSGRRHSEKDNEEIKHLMTHIIHDVDGQIPRCYGPSCQEGFNAEEGPQKDFEDFSVEPEIAKDYREVSKDRLQAISALAAKLKRDKFKVDLYSSVTDEEPEEEEDGNGKVWTSWNRLKVKQHKHPYDDKDGWVTMEPVAWSTSKVSKWQPNVKKHQKPTTHWNDDDDEDDRFPSDNNYSPYQNVGVGNTYSYTQKKPSFGRPQFINNKLHVTSGSDYDSEMPSKPSWARPSNSYTSTWSPDEGRRPQKPNCDHEENYSSDPSILYGISDSVITDHRPSKFPYEYQALHQSGLQRPVKRPTQVVYAGSPEFDSDRASRPPNGDGQWVLLSTTKGYRNKKRQRSLNPAAEDHLEFAAPSVTSHQAVSLTVLPVDNAHTNMTTSHGGMLEVEKSFKTVEESKRDMDRSIDLVEPPSQTKPKAGRILRRKVVSNLQPDSSTLLAAVGAGMVPATMAMVVPMMLGRRRRRRDITPSQAIPVNLNLDNLLYKYQ